MIFEACGDGVDVTTWTYFMENDWNLLYDKMYYRKLEWDIPPKNKDALENFVASAIGKKYSLNPAKFFRQASKYQDDAADDKTFFCSELVAASYKRLGILPKNKSSASYFPADFSMKSELKLLNGAKFNHEQVIHFEL